MSTLLNKVTVYWLNDEREPSDNLFIVHKNHVWYYHNKLHWLQLKKTAFNPEWPNVYKIGEYYE